MPIPHIDATTLKSSSYDDIVQGLISSIRQCIDWMRDVDIACYKRSNLTHFVHQNRKQVAQLVAIIDTYTVGSAGDTNLYLDEKDTTLDRLLFEFNEACNALLLRLDTEKSNTTKADRLKRLMILVFFCSMSLVLSTSSTFCIKKIQHEDCKFTFLVMLLQGLSFILNFCIWMGTLWWKRRKGVGSSSQPFGPRFRAYLILGAIDAVHLVLQSLSLKELSGSIYNVLKGSGIIFSVFLSKIVVKKMFLLEHWLAVGLMLISTVGCALFEQSDSSKDDFSKFMLGYSLTLCSCFLVALLGVLQQKLMVNVKHTNETIDVMAEANFFQSMVVFPIVLIVALSNSEAQKWGPIAVRFYDDGTYAFFVIAVALVLVRSLSVFSAMGITTYASAMFSRSYNAAKNSTQTIILMCLLNEDFKNSMKFSLPMSTISFTIYVYAGHLLQQMKLGKKPADLRNIFSKCSVVCLK